MRRLFFLSTCILLLLVAFDSNGQVTDSLHQQLVTTSIDSSTIDSTQPYSDADLAPGLLFLTLIGIGLITFCFGIGSVVAVILLLLLFGFVTLGILSSSVFVGLSRRSFTSGFKTFVVSTISIVGMVLGITVLYISNYLFSFHLSSVYTLWIGASSGLIAGLLLGWVFFLLLQLLLRLFKQWLRLN